MLFPFTSQSLIAAADSFRTQSPPSTAIEPTTSNPQLRPVSSSVNTDPSSAVAYSSSSTASTSAPSSSAAPPLAMVDAAPPPMTAPRSPGLLPTVLAVAIGGASSSRTPASLPFAMAAPLASTASSTDYIDDDDDDDDDHSLVLLPASIDPATPPAIAPSAPLSVFFSPARSTKVTPYRQVPSSLVTSPVGSPPLAPSEQPSSSTTTPTTTCPPSPCPPSPSSPPLQHMRPTTPDSDTCSLSSFLESLSAEDPASGVDSLKSPSDRSSIHSGALLEDPASLDPNYHHLSSSSSIAALPAANDDGPASLSRGNSISTVSLASSTATGSSLNLQHLPTRVLVRSPSIVSSASTCSATSTSSSSSGKTSFLSRRKQATVGMPVSPAASNSTISSLASGPTVNAATSTSHSTRMHSASSTSSMHLDSPGGEHAGAGTHALPTAPTSSHGSPTGAFGMTKQSAFNHSEDFTTASTPASAPQTPIRPSHLQVSANDAILRAESSPGLAPASAAAGSAAASMPASPATSSQYLAAVTASTPGGGNSTPGSRSMSASPSINFSMERISSYDTRSEQAMGTIQRGARSVNMFSINRKMITDKLFNRSMMKSPADMLDFTVEDAVLNSDLRAALITFASSEFSEENVIFLGDVISLKRNRDWHRIEEMVREYIHTDSPMALNIEYKTRDTILKRVSLLTPEYLDSMTDDDDITLFDTAFKEIVRLVETNVFPRFKAQYLAARNVKPMVDVIDHTRRVVIVGGGMVGAYAALLLDQMPRFHVTLIDTKEYFEFTPGITQVFADPSKVDRFRLPHASYLRNGRIIVGHVNSITPTSVRVENVDHPCDYMIFASGSSYNSQIKGRNVTTAYRTKKVTNEFQILQRARRVLIIGGGAVGVQLAAEFAEKFPEKKISLVSSNPLLLRRLPSSAHQLAKMYLQSMGVQLILGERVIGIDQSGTILQTDKGTILECDKFYLAVGLIPQTKYLQNSLPSLVDEDGFITVTNTLQVEGYSHMFAGGDSSNLPCEKLAIAAASHGVTIARNICRLEKARPPLVLGEKGTASSSDRPIAQIVSIGGQTAIFAVRGMQAMANKKFLKTKDKFERDMINSLHHKAPIHVLLGKPPRPLKAGPRP
ncbi:hypothetical protein, variant [Fonticula alba]|uniref:RGS domain-containing protein n=1 Tax=Fonticula alba TaxID=691883 RepID=A0A058Z7S0_FONAL|nr:hypothetical protein, variant [Fonticula alba]KCV70161.1 hypothetical protein, variant [Fonticula alba]|eukprot:XP_009495767.1 hypothetical protein, variant [Fonticula alba]